MEQISEKLQVLLVEDEPHLAFSLKINLEQEGLVICHASTGPDAIRAFDTGGPFALIVLDVMLPDLDGFSVAEAIRRKNDKVGILMLTARASDEDRLRGFALGADDYITKPFHLAEFIARVRRMLQRAQWTQERQLPETFSFGDFELCPADLVLKTPSGPVTLTKLEADLLLELLSHKGEVLSREYLLEKVWGVKATVETRTVDNFVMRLRRLIEIDPEQPERIASIRGRGYVFRG